MRRKDREMDEAFALAVIDHSPYGVLSFCHEQRSVARALSLVREGHVLYFHSATGGEKVDFFTEGLPVSLVFVSHVQVPDFLSNTAIDHMIEKGDSASLLTKVFTTEFSSAMVEGKLRCVTEQKEKNTALRRICEVYTPGKMQYFDRAVALSLDKVHVYAVDIEKITGKRKKFDEQGEEMKWGRSE